VLRKLAVSLKRDEALRATRVTIGKKKLVYVLVTDKRLKYPKGKSRIAYFGTTKTGVSRVAESVAVRADRILGLHGVWTFHARIVTCGCRRHVATWKKLERALLIRFRKKFGKVPECNLQGKGMKETDEFRYFRRARIDNVIDELS
jgi:hypothetical protein